MNTFSRNFPIWSCRVQREEFLCVCVSLYIPVQYYFTHVASGSCDKECGGRRPTCSNCEAWYEMTQIGISHWFIDVKHINIPRVLQNLAASQCAWCWVWRSRALTRQKHKQEVTQKKASEAVCGGWRRNRYYSCFNAVQLLFDWFMFDCCSVVVQFVSRFYCKYF